MPARRWSSLRRASDIAEVRSRGRRASHGAVTVWARPSDAPSRAALSVPVRTITHVERNRARRRLRAVLDEVLPPTGWDVVIGLRAGPMPAAPDLRAGLVGALERALERARGAGPGVG